MSSPYRQAPVFETIPTTPSAHGESLWFYLLMLVIVGACVLEHAVR